MSDDNKLKLGARPPLGLKRTEAAGNVKQSFSHGRTNTVQVEVKRRRVLTRPGEAPQAVSEPEVVAAPEPAPTPAPVQQRPVAPPPPPQPRREEPQRALTPHEALSTLFGQRRAQFDNLVLTTFVRSVGIYPPGTVVTLSNGTLGLVVSVNSSRPLKPTVLVYDPAVPKDSAIVVDLEEEPDVAVASTLRPAQLPAAVFDYLSPRKRTTYYFNTDKPG